MPGFIGFSFAEYLTLQRQEGLIISVSSGEEKEKVQGTGGTQRWHARGGTTSAEEAITRTEVSLEGLMPQEILNFYSYPKSLALRVHTLYIL